MFVDKIFEPMTFIVASVSPADIAIILTAMFAQALKELGIPSPGVTQGALIYAGIQLTTGNYPTGMAIILAIAFGSLCGASAAYSFGRFLGVPFVNRFGKYIKYTPGKMDQIKNKLHNKATLAVLLGRFVPAIMAPLSITAGIMRMPVAKYAIGIAVSVILWELFFVGIGAITGKVLDVFNIPGINVLLPAILVAAVMLILLITGLLWVLRRRRKESIDTLHLDYQERMDK